MKDGDRLIKEIRKEIALQKELGLVEIEAKTEAELEIWIKGNIN